MNLLKNKSNNTDYLKNKIISHDIQMTKNGIIRPL